VESELARILSDSLYKSRSSIFTRGVNELLRQEVSEIRSHINYQIMLVAAISTLIAVILTAVF